MKFYKQATEESSQSLFKSFPTARIYISNSKRNWLKFRLVHEKKSPYLTGSAEGIEWMNLFWNITEADFLSIVF